VLFLVAAGARESNKKPTTDASRGFSFKFYSATLKIGTDGRAAYDDHRYSPQIQRKTIHGPEK
jgi:hypothetical protein